jgi:2-oxoglutarate dehydrogenase E1 component
MQHRFSAEEKRNILWQLTAAEGLERYLHTKYVGQKRFSLEGGDSADRAARRSGAAGRQGGIEEVVIGMAHRGRLNVLVNLLGKSPKDLFSNSRASTTSITARLGRREVPQGLLRRPATPGGNVHVALAFNPSHLEVVDPVVEGSVRARQERRGDAQGRQGAAGADSRRCRLRRPGRVMETLQLSQARGFYTGGTVHIIINNQVGFTTSDPRDARSTLYCSDVAKMVEAPILHVNADDPEAVCSSRAWRSLPHEVPQGRRDRPGVLPPPRPQRGRRAGRDAAGDVPGDPQAADRAQLYADRLRRRGRARRRGGAAMVEQYRKASMRASRRRAPRSA